MSMQVNTFENDHFASIEDARTFGNGGQTPRERRERLMNPWSPASWQQIRRRVWELTGIRFTFERIEQFVDENYLWEESPETITARLVEATYE